MLEECNVESFRVKNLGYESLVKGDYSKAANFYEQKITTEPDIKTNYWYLGLVFLLQGQETEAQTTWLIGMGDGEAEDIEIWTVELNQVLENEAQRRETLEDYSVAWAIRQHIRELNPSDIINLFHLIELSIHLKMDVGEELTSLGLIDLLNEEPASEVDTQQLLELLPKILDYIPLHPATLTLTEACLAHIPNPNDLIPILLKFVYDTAYLRGQQRWAIKFIELGLRIAPLEPELLRAISSFYAEISEHTKAIESAKLAYSLVTHLPEKIFDNHMILRGLMSAGGYWEEAASRIKEHKHLIEKLLEEYPTNLGSGAHILRLYNATFFFNYIQDKPKENAQLRNRLSRFCQTNIEIDCAEEVERYRQGVRSTSRQHASKKLKIGYISHCLRKHSVGWLARGLFQYHNRENFELYAYIIGPKETSDSLEGWYINQVSKAYKVGLGGLEVAEQIYKDEIDILVDLDSITLNSTCGFMSLKPAPIQVTWLGWDASGVPAIDYFIADPYVLPESAQEYYQETIWRLPQTYIAIDGFDVGVPTLRRDQLNIPTDAVVFYSGQRGFKHNPQTAHLHMKIIKEVPNSYFIIKGWGSEESLNRFFIDIAEQEGVNPDRLRFLPGVATEEIHRANLGIVDVVLDTYPYNGATTTMETLWMGIPLVARVGEQFSSRNSYGMMINAGITEGIAWTDEEYLDWGIKLGTDEHLRQNISWKLKKNRQTAPLWNAKQFTLEMEKAYEQMWQRYLDSH
ncbi:O-linked N-acetylglucosamine transferase family protein [Planktothrix pseudagardhii]|uniref:UDP-N-acetylglucosamine--peptide N-acetylglucosaminyltransferase SPINDLY n=1 Tax=Planktothrix pseudagardhii TaxID=132604 RepID=A0A9W4CN00_9CYAN|nr:O-linked N-acetylglucosamine transferase, SPINDLY family protein [Planktothrix pseudagardhii]CAD5960250.1 putative UDP-N-acetylglucosamine--peptide N-acetylglucosaminyltransferase SPINDLY [Planktothrix pseudagardhii]